MNIEYRIPRPRARDSGQVSNTEAGEGPRIPSTFKIRSSIFNAGLWAFPLLLLLAPECTRPRFPVVPPVQKPSREYLARSRAQSHFIKALDFDRRGLTQLADRYLQSAYALDPTSTTLRDILIGRYINGGRYREALVLIKKDKKTAQLPDGDKRLLARVYLKMGQFQDAASVLELLADKSDEEVFSLGLIYEAQGSLDKAFATYRDYLRRNPQSRDVGVKIGLLLIKSRHYAEAESLLVELSRRFPGNTMIFDALGICKLAAGDTTPALNFFETALLADSANEDALRNAAQIHLQRGNPAKAALYYERLASQRPYGSVYAKTLVWLYYYTEQYDKARDLARRLLEDDVNDLDLHFYLGLVASAQNDSDVAALEFEKALALQPTFVEAWRKLCYLFIKQRRLDDALAVARRFTDEMPENAASWSMLGIVHNVRKEYDRAMTPLRRSVALDSTDRVAWFELGSVLERRQKFDSAAVAFRRVLRIQPDDDQAANYLGYMWAERGIHLDSARTLLLMALGKEPDNGAYLDSYAWIAYQMGDYDQALEFIEKAVERIHDDAVVLEHYGDILVKKGELLKALDAYEKSLKLGAEVPDRISKKVRETRKSLGL